MPEPKESKGEERMQKGWLRVLVIVRQEKEFLVFYCTVTTDNDVLYISEMSEERILKKMKKKKKEVF